MCYRVLIVVTLFTSLAGTPHAAAQTTSKPLSPMEAAATMRVPDGFKVTLFAGEPDVVQPIGFCIDDRGRLWVAEANNYPNKKAGLHDRIIILEDTDNDGTHDKRTVFYDKLEYVTGIEVGFGGVWVMSPPNMYFVPDRDGDDVPDGEPIVLLDGFGTHANAHNLANGFAWGPDGWLYATHGRTNWSVVGPPGTPQDKRLRLDGGLWRYHPVTHKYEWFADGTTNPWGVDFDDYGEAFCCNCVNPHLFHMIQGAHYEPWRNRKSSQFAYQRIKTIADHLHYEGKSWTDSRKGTAKTLEMGGGHAHSGTMVYLGGAWPKRYRNTVFMNNIHGKRINNDVLKRRGSGYVATHGKDFMFAKDPWFVGVTVAYGPDGNVYVSDWSDTGECHHTRNTQRTTGRLFKVVYAEQGGDATKQGTARRGVVNVAAMTDRELVEQHLNRNDWWVRHARRVLQERAAAGRLSDEAVGMLISMIRSQGDVTRRLRALWTLHAIGKLDAPMPATLLADENEHIRAWAVRLELEDRAVSGDLHARLVSMAESDPSPVVRLALASGLQRLPFARRWPIAERLAMHAEDEDDQNLPLMIWYGVEPIVPADKARALKLAQTTRIGIIRQFIARRLAE